LMGSGFLAAVELSEIVVKNDSGNSLLLRGDLYDETIRKQLIERGPYDLVMCDAAPNTSGNSTVDTLRSAALVEAAIDYAEACLKRGGNFVAKIFQGGNEAALLARLRTMFETARGFKPQACRTESFETYLIGLRRK
jgi:23S rRNA (uridine2552-2'-O)-methyltransferase